MTATFRSVAHTDVPVAVASWAVTLPAGIAVGDFIIAQLGSDRNTATTITGTPTGWTTIPGTTNPTMNAGAADCLAFYYQKRLQAGDPELLGVNPVWTFASSSAGTAVMAAYVNTDPVTPVDTASSVGVISGTSHATPVIAPSVNNCTIVGGVFIDKTVSTSPGTYFTPPVGWAERVDAEAAVIFVESTLADATQAIAAPISGTFTSVDADASTTFIVALRPGPDAPVTGDGGGETETPALTFDNVPLIASTLLSCLCQAVSGRPSPPMNCCYRIGEEVAHDADLFTDLCCEGLAYVSLGDIYPSSDAFPEQEIVRQANQACGFASWAVVFKIGIIRCVPTGTDTTMPSCDDWTAAAIQQFSDAAALRQAACCFKQRWIGSLDPGMSVVIGPNSTTSPEGGCVERFVTINVQMTNCDFPC